MEPKKLEIDEKLKLRLEEMDKILTKLCPDDPEEYREVLGGGGCGAICSVTCSYYCRAACEDTCKDSCGNTCKGLCGGFVADLPGIGSCGVSMIIWYI